MPKDGYLTPEGSNFGSATGLTKDQLLQHAYRPLWVWLRNSLVTAYWLAWFVMLITAIVIIKNAPKCNSPPPLQWWQKSPMYQIQVASFSDGGHPVNGLGDIAGLQSRLKYIQRLGVRTVCLSPIFDSPLNDSTSAINLRNIASHFGTLEDFVSLVRTFRQKDMKLVLDFIPSHTSNKHQWFQKSVKREDPYTHFYVWNMSRGEDAQGNPLPPNNWMSLNNATVWEWNEQRKEFYFHQYSRDQPDLNYRSPELLQEIKDILSLWLNYGVDGIRVLNVGRLVGSNGTFNNPLGFDLLKEFREVIDNSSIGESKVLLVEDDIPPEDLLHYYGSTAKPLAHLAISTIFTSNIQSNISGLEMFTTVRRWLESLPGTAWPIWMVGDKDVKRLASRVGSSLAEAINMVTLLLPGTPLTYYGDEIGMEDVKDINEYSSTQLVEEAISYSPMQWNSSKHAGFSSANSTWIPINENYLSVNVEAEEHAEWSHIKVYRALVETRNSEAVMNGKTELKLLEKQVFAYTRIKKGAPGFLVIANFDAEAITVDLTAMKFVPRMSSVVAYSTAYKGTNYKVRSKIVNNAIFLPGQAGVVLTFVPKFAIDISDPH